MLAAVLLYRRTTTYPYVLDDNYVVASNRWVQQGFSGLLPLLEGSYWDGYFGGYAQYYRPLPMLSYAVEFGLFGMDPGISHAVNVGLYALTALLVYRFVERVSGGWLLPTLAGALFVASPLHVEVAANIKSRDELFVLIFQLSALIGAVDLVRSWAAAPRRWAQGAVVSVSILCALLAKESGLLVLALLPLTLWTVTDLKPLRIAGWTAGLGAVPLVLYFGQRLRVTGALLSVSGGAEVIENNALWAADSASEHWGMIAWMITDYARLLVYPAPLLWDRSLGYIPIIDLSSPRAWLGIGIAVTWAGLTLWQLRKRSLPGLALSWMAVCYALPSNILVRVDGSTMAERYLYTFTLGFCLLLAWGLSRAFSLDRAPLPFSLKGLERAFFPLGLGAIVALLWSAATLQRVPAWSSLSALIAADVDSAQGNARLISARLGELIPQRELAQDPNEKAALRREISELLATSEALLVEDPRRYQLLRPELLWARGMSAFQDKDWALARAELEALVALSPTHYRGWWHLGFSCYQLGDYVCASESWYEALEQRPKQGFAPGDRVLLQDYYFNLCLAEQQLGAWESSLESCRGALQWDPRHAQAQAGVGIALTQLGRTEEGQAALEAAYEMDPSLRP